MRHTMAYAYFDLRCESIILFFITPCIECCSDSSCLCTPVNKEKSTGRKDMGITIAQ